jgi:DNA gyrase inhibitor GyrI
MDKVYLALSGAGIVSTKGIGIYYDDPAVVSGTQLRSDVGAIIESADAAKLAKVQDIQTKTLPGGTKMMVEFPLKNSVSYMAGPIKVYPLLTKYIQKK